MADIFTRKKRSTVMSAIRSRGNAATELRLIALFRAHGFTGWRRGATLRGPAARANAKPFRVKPDFVFRSHRLAVFVDGCFWHGPPPPRLPRGNLPPPRHPTENQRFVLA
jgi:DNA mismatch endonuclease (patch repair protein)